MKDQLNIHTGKPLGDRYKVVITETVKDSSVDGSVVTTTKHSTTHMSHYHGPSAAVAGAFAAWSPVEDGSAILISVKVVA